MPKILLKFNAAVLKELDMQKESISVGRKADNDIVIDNPAISGHHCRIALEGGTYYVEDLESTNGTFVNQKRVKKSGLHHNDVVGVAKHALVFLEDQPVEAIPPPPETEPVGEATMIISPQRQAEMNAASASAAKQDGAQKSGMLRVLKGQAGAVSEYELKGMSTYIGKSDRVQIPIKGSGLFGGAPEVAASVHRRAEGYVLMAVEAGYPSVNGSAVNGSVVLKDGDLIECGGTTMQFVLKAA